jgi:methyl-accepting chemotaxis protein
MTKLLLATGVMCVIVIAVGLVGLGEVTDMRDLSTEMYEHELLGVSAAKDIHAGTLLGAADLARVVAHPETAGKVRQRLTVLRGDLDAALEQLRTSDAGQDASPDELAVRRGIPELLSAGEALIGAVEASDPEGIRVAEEHVGEQAKLIQGAVAHLATQRMQRAHEEHAHAGQIYEESRSFMLGFVIVALLVGVVLAVGIARMISVPLAETVGVLERVAGGDLTESLPEGRLDEVGRMASALNRAVASMRDTLSEVRQAAASVASTAHELTAASQDISSGAQEQASGLEEASASLEQMAEAIRQNAAGAERASGVSAESKQVAMRGSEVVAEAVSAMSSVDAASQRIAQIIGTIDEIAFQTNLLALNAAVEAARAGDQGRGFAVVASEVRNLAQRSASAAKEIKELIGDSTRRVEAGSRLVNESGKSLKEILDAVGRVSDLVQEIAAASKEQSIGVGHVNTAVMQADRVTQANAAQTEELSGSAEALSANSAQLLGLASRFRLSTDDAGDEAPLLSMEARRTSIPVLSEVRGRRNSEQASALAPTGTDGFEEF